MLWIWKNSLKTVLHFTAAKSPVQDILSLFNFLSFIRLCDCESPKRISQNADSAPSRGYSRALALL